MRVLFVAMSHSIHTARWIKQLEGTGWDVHLFPIPWKNQVKVHPFLRNLTVHDALWGRPDGLDSSVATVNHCWPKFRDGLPFGGGRKVVRRFVDRHWPLWCRLARAIKAVKPDVIPG